jgi:hypothetical protein
MRMSSKVGKGVRYEWHCRDFIGAQVDLGLTREFL